MPTVYSTVSTFGMADTSPRPALAQPLHRSAAFHHAQTDVVHLHDQSHHSVRDGGDEQRHNDEDRRPSGQRLVDHLLEGDHHDFGRQDEVGADRPRHGLLLVIGGEGVLELVSVRHSGGVVTGAAGA